MREETLRWRGGWARLRPWRGHADVAELAMGAQLPPTPEVVQRCLTLLRRRGYARVVTTALLPADTLPFVDAGFAVHERLHLLSHDMHDLPGADQSTRRARRDERAAVLALDDAAFEPFWRLDEAGLRSALDATPHSRFRVAGPQTVLAYAITGRAVSDGYLQRVAVHPHARRQGLGRAMVADGLRWLRRHGVRRALVNTQLHNGAALALYESCGFSALPSGLCVLGRQL